MNYYVKFAIGFTVGALLGFAFTDISKGAEIYLVPEEAAIAIEGDIVAGDGFKFGALAGQNPKIETVYLNSDGGVWGDAMIIGLITKERGYDTLAFDYCHSACGYIWLAGDERMSFDQTSMQMHLPYNPYGNTDIVESITSVAWYFGTIDLDFLFIQEFFDRIDYTENNMFEMVEMFQW